MKIKKIKNAENRVQMSKKNLPLVLSQQDSHQHASHENGVTSFLVGTSNKGIFQTANQMIKGQNEE